MPLPARSSSMCFPLISLLMLPCLGPVVVFGGGTDAYTRAEFPAGFVFGAGSSAYQVEGAASEDGRTPSIWDTFVRSDKISALLNGANGDIACGQYHKYKEDVQLMVETGLDAYRFSISWSRLIPNGKGPINPKGLEYYNNLINELISHGIQPHVTLYHFDTPQALEDEYGGWISQNMVKDFVAYVDVCFREFGDRVSHWTTLNEANIHAIGGYDNGMMPPGRCSLPYGWDCPKGNSSTEPYIAAHNMLLAHSYAVKLYKKKYKATQHGFVGINIFAPWFLPNTKAIEDVIATQRAIDYYIGWFLHPLVFGDYPQIIKKNAGTRIPTFSTHESKLVKGSFDFIGLNHYIVLYVVDNPSSLEMESRDLESDMAINSMFNPGDRLPHQFPLTPFGLYGILEYIKNTYGNPPIYVHENGQYTQRNGTLDDSTRVIFMQAYTGSMLDAVRNGSNTRGYFLWSFLDGFELLGGYNMGFGLYYVDLDDKQLRRYPKLSANWYSNFLKGRSMKHTEIIAAENDGFVSSIPNTSE